MANILSKLTDKDVEALEHLVDSHGLVEVINTLKTICDEKAEHLIANWQEPKSDQTKTWQHNANYLNRVSTHIWRQSWERE